MGEEKWGSGSSGVCCLQRWDTSYGVQAHSRTGWRARVAHRWGEVGKTHRCGNPSRRVVMQSLFDTLDAALLWTDPRYTSDQRRWSGSSHE
jgi:hypothetical protein